MEEEISGPVLGVTFRTLVEAFERANNVAFKVSLPKSGHSPSCCLIDENRKSEYALFMALVRILVDGYSLKYPSLE
jgi:hypothetical protein